MILERFSTQHRIGEAGVEISRRTDQSGAGQSWLQIETWTIRARLLNPSGDPIDMDALIASVEALYSQDGGDLRLLHDDGTTPTQHVLLDADTIGGIRVKQPPTFAKYQGGEYVMFRTYVVVLEAIKPLIEVNSLAVWDWKEKLRFSGGLPRKVFLEPNVGTPIEQQGKEHTTFKASQSGVITGCFDYILPPDPIWSGAIMDQQFENLEPTYLGANGSIQMVRFPTSYSYQFESATALTGVPGTLY